MPRLSVDPQRVPCGCLAACPAVRRVARCCGCTIMDHNYCLCEACYLALLSFWARFGDWPLSDWWLVLLLVPAGRLRSLYRSLWCWCSAARNTPTSSPHTCGTQSTGIQRSSRQQQRLQHTVPPTCSGGCLGCSQTHLLVQVGIKQALQRL